jgi:(R)-2-hydroxyacyl-CoA dehydratese activating ATPase
MFAGVDVGSISTEAVIFDGSKVLGVALIPTGGSPRKAGAAALERALVDAGVERGSLTRIIATGYGRVSVDFAHQVVTEITCHARGAHFLDNSVDMVIDIGGQDSKVIVLEQDGTPIDFAMNDKCAAGTGRFLEVMARALELSLEELSTIGINRTAVPISNVCTVFAESEVISLLAADVQPPEICAGIYQSVADRVAALVQRVGLQRSIMFSGGVCKNAGVRKALEASLEVRFKVPPEPQIIGALGAAIIASQKK